MCEVCHAQEIIQIKDCLYIYSLYRYVTAFLSIMAVNWQDHQRYELLSFYGEKEIWLQICAVIYGNTSSLGLSINFAN